MNFEEPLTEGRLIKRYKRFLADVTLPDGTVVTAHCANSGSMKGCAEQGARVWLSPNRSKTAKLDWRWELVEIGGAMIGINTNRPNAVAAEAISAGQIPELAGYATLKREVKYGKNSRIDILLQGPGLAYVEVKNVTLAGGDCARFPDAVTARGTKHLHELSDMVTQGYRAVMLYLVNRDDCRSMAPADDIDPVYGQAMRKAKDAGVELLAYRTLPRPVGIQLDVSVPIILP